MFLPSSGIFSPIWRNCVLRRNIWRRSKGKTSTNYASWRPNTRPRPNREIPRRPCLAEVKPAAAESRPTPSIHPHPPDKEPDDLPRVRGGLDSWSWIMFAKHGNSHDLLTLNVFSNEYRNSCFGCTSQPKPGYCFRKCPYLITPWWNQSNGYM